jgi:hypothetical protein
MITLEQEQHSSKTGVTPTPISWKRMVVLLALVLAVSVLAAVILAGHDRGLVNPEPSPSAPASCVVNEPCS